MNDVLPPPVEELQAQIAELLAQVEQLQAENHRLVCAEDEKRLALEVVEQQQQQLSQMAAQLEYSKLELNRAGLDREELEQLRKRDRMIDGICATPHEQLGPYEKLVMIQAHKQTSYSAARHGGPAEVRLTSFEQWSMSVGGAEKVVRRVVDALKPGGTIVDERIDTGDGKKHYAIALNDAHFANPRRLVRPEKADARKNNGGDKQCPQCKQALRRNLVLTYECSNCGIDYDRDLSPVNHHLPAPLPEKKEEVPKPDNVLKFVPRELPMPDETPLPDLLTEDDLNAFGPKKARG